MVVANITMNPCYLKTLNYFKLKIFTLSGQNKNVFKAWRVLTTSKVYNLKRFFRPDQRERERERKRERERETERERERERQTDRQRDRETERQRDRERRFQTEMFTKVNVIVCTS